MKALSRFVTKFTCLIGATLSFFDRVIIKGHVALAVPSQLEAFVDFFLKVRRTHFKRVLALQYSELLAHHARDRGRSSEREKSYVEARRGEGSEKPSWGKCL